MVLPRFLGLFDQTKAYPLVFWPLRLASTTLLALWSPFFLLILLLQSNYSLMISSFLSILTFPTIIIASHDIKVKRDFISDIDFLTDSMHSKFGGRHVFGRLVCTPIRS